LPNPKPARNSPSSGPPGFHLQPAEVEALAADLDDARVKQAAVRPSAWE